MLLPQKANSAQPQVAMCQTAARRERVSAVLAARFSQKPHADRRGARRVLIPI